MTKAIRGSKRLGRWLESDSLEILKIYSAGRIKYDGIVVRFRKTGYVAFISPERHKSVYKEGRSSITTARKEKVTTWPLSPIQFDMAMTTYKLDYVIIYLTDTDDIWVSSAKDWRDRTKRIFRTTKSGSGMYHLPEKYSFHIPNKEPLLLN